MFNTAIRMLDEVDGGIYSQEQLPIDVNPKYSLTMEVYRQCIGEPTSTKEWEMLEKWFSLVEKGLVTYAILQANKRKIQSSLYVNGIIERLCAEGITTMAALHEREQAHVDTISGG